MSRIAADDDDALRYAEYVLGVLDADRRAAIADEIGRSDEAAAVALWQRRLMPLAHEVAEESPPPHVWQAIRRRLALDAPTPRAGAWENLALWRWIGATATALAVAVLATVAIRPEPPPAMTIHARLRVSTLLADDGTPRYTVIVDTARAEALVLPDGADRLDASRSPQLWLIPQGGRPVSMGVVSPAAPTRIAIDRATVAPDDAEASLAVSLEPMGGSPTGQPTGRIVAKGSLRPAG